MNAGKAIVEFEQLYDYRIEREAKHRDECTKDSKRGNVGHQQIDKRLWFGLYWFHLRGLRNDRHSLLKKLLLKGATGRERDKVGQVTVRVGDLDAQRLAVAGLISAIVAQLRVTALRHETSIDVTCTLATTRTNRVDLDCVFRLGLGHGVARLKVEAVDRREQRNTLGMKRREVNPKQ